MEIIKLDKNLKYARLADTLKNIEYFHITKNGKTLLQFGEEINGTTKTELQKKIGNALGEGIKSYVLKYKHDPQSKVGTIRAFSDVPEGKKQVVEDNISSEVMKRIEAMQSAINSKNNIPDINTLLNIKDAAYNIQINFYLERIKQLEATITKLENQLDEAGESGGGLMDQLLPVLLQAFAKK